MTKNKVSKEDVDWSKNMSRETDDSKVIPMMVDNSGVIPMTVDDSKILPFMVSPMKIDKKLWDYKPGTPEEGRIKWTLIANRNLMMEKNK